MGQWRSGLRRSRSAAVGREEGAAKRARVMPHEVAARQPAARALRDSEARLRTIVDALDQGIILHDERGKIVSCNPAAMRMLGLTAEELLGRRSIDPVCQAARADGSPFPVDDHPAIVALRTGLPQSDVVMGISRPDGSSAWLSIDERPIVDPGSEQPDAVVVTLTDVTDRLQLEREQRRVESLYRTLARNIPNGAVALFDHDLRYTWSLAAAWRWLGSRPSR